MKEKKNIVLGLFCIRLNLWCMLFMVFWLIRLVFSSGLVVDSSSCF